MLQYAGSTWHEDCFVCHGCEKPIGAGAFIPDDSKYYCVPCYQGLFAPQCSHCKKVKKRPVRSLSPPSSVWVHCYINPVVLRAWPSAPD